MKELKKILAIYRNHILITKIRTAWVIIEMIFVVIGIITFLIYIFLYLMLVSWSNLHSGINKPIYPIICEKYVDSDYFK